MTTKPNSSKLKSFSHLDIKEIGKRYYRKLFVSLYTSRKILVFYKREDDVCS